MPSLAKLMPSAGSGISGGTSSAGRSTPHLPSASPADAPSCHLSHSAAVGRTVPQEGGPIPQHANADKRPCTSLTHHAKHLQNRTAKGSMRALTIHAQVLPFWVALVVKLLDICLRDSEISFCLLLTP